MRPVQGRIRWGFLSKESWDEGYCCRSRCCCFFKSMDAILSGWNVEIPFGSPFFLDSYRQSITQKEKKTVKQTKIRRYMFGKLCSYEHYGSSDSGNDKYSLCHYKLILEQCNIMHMMTSSQCTVSTCKIFIFNGKRGLNLIWPTLL